MAGALGPLQTALRRTIQTALPELLAKYLKRQLEWSENHNLLTIIGGEAATISCMNVHCNTYF